MTQKIKIRLGDFIFEILVKSRKIKEKESIGNALVSKSLLKNSISYLVYGKT